MAADDHISVNVRDLVVALYRADWTTLCLAAEVTEFTDYQAQLRMLEAGRPPWIPPPGQRPGSRPGSEPARRGWADIPEEEDDGSDHYELRTAREVTHHLLLAPDGRFRLETQSSGGFASVRGSDGQVTWAVHDSDDDADPEDRDPEDRDPDDADPDDAATSEPTVSAARPPCDELLCPAWLPATFRLELAGSAVAAGRPAHRVIGTRRPVSRGRGHLSRSRALPGHRSSLDSLDGVERIDALVDAELGILLRSERMYGGQVVSRLEITSITLDPADAADTGQFTAPSGAVGSGAEWSFSGPGWERAKRVASLGATAMSFAIRYAPNREPPAGSRPGPADSPADSEGDWAGQPGPDEPVSAQILGLLYHAGLRRTGFDAELRTWADAATTADVLQRAARKTTLSGVSQLAEAVSARATTWQSREAIRVGLPDRYRIDYIDGGVKHPASTIEAADGAKRWRVYPGHVTVGPARQLPDKVARLADPAWLLDWQLTGGAEVIHEGRHAFRIKIGPRWQAADAHELLQLPIAALVDAQLGVLLRLTEEQSGRPSKQQTLSAFTVRQQRDAADFRIEIPDGTRVVQERGGWTDEIDVPAPVQTAVHLAGKAVSAAVKIGTFLESLRPSAGDGEHR